MESKQESSVPVIAVTALILHPETDETYTFLVGKCKSDHNSGIYELPAGNLEYGVSWSNFIHKTVKSTTNLDIKASDWNFCFVSNDKIPRHYVEIVMSTIYKGDINRIKNQKENKYSRLEWIDFRYHGIDEDKMFGALKSVLISDVFHPLRSNAYSNYVSFDNLMHDDDDDDDEKVKVSSSSKLECPFVTIDDEVYQIKEDGVNASMNVTSYNGELLPPFLSSKGLIYLNKHFKTNKLDIFIDTFAKSGTTLTIKLVHQILSANNENIAVSDAGNMSDPWKAVPWIEAIVSQELFKNKKSVNPEKFVELISCSNKNKEWRIWKSHMSFGNLLANIDKNGECKIIHTLRNPKAVFCSYSSFFPKEPSVSYQGDINTLFDWFCDGTVVHSNYWHFELEWIKAAKQKKNILLIQFEEIVKNPHQSIKRVAKFLNIILNQQQIEQIAKEISFDKMKQENKSHGAKILMNKGGIDRWKTVLSPKQSARIDRITNAKFNNSDIKLTYQ